MLKQDQYHLNTCLINMKKDRYASFLLSSSKKKVTALSQTSQFYIFYKLIKRKMLITKVHGCSFQSSCLSLIDLLLQEGIYCQKCKTKALIS